MSTIQQAKEVSYEKVRMRGSQVKKITQKYMCVHACLKIYTKCSGQYMANHNIRLVQK